jgi:uncharacterized protein YdeI (BOF family)
MKTSTLAFLLALLFGASVTAVAQSQNQPQGEAGHGAFRQACGADIQTYCSAAQSRDDRHACIKANTDKFSDTCKSLLASHTEHMHGQGYMHGQDQM